MSTIINNTSRVKMDKQKRKLLTIGGTGLVGSRVNEILSQKYDIENFSSSTGVNITDKETLSPLKDDSLSDYVILYAAKTDIDACEKDKDLGKEGEAYKVNVLGVENVIDALKNTNKKLIYISTDFVFSGENTPEKGYREEDPADPVDWYGQTKLMGENIVRNSALPYLICRIGYPYRVEFAKKNDYLRIILFRLKNNQPVKAISDHIMTPTFIDDIASALDYLISKKETGIFHVTGNQSLSPYDAALLIAEKFKLDKSLISPCLRAEFFKDRAPRPFNLTVNNDKIHKLGIEMKTFISGLDEF